MPPTACRTSNGSIGALIEEFKTFPLPSNSFHLRKEMGREVPLPWLADLTLSTSTLPPAEPEISVRHGDGEESEAARLERLGRQRPAQLKTLRAEIAFGYSILTSMITAVSLPFHVLHVLPLLLLPTLLQTHPSSASLTEKHNRSTSSPASTSSFPTSSVNSTSPKPQWSGLLPPSPLSQPPSSFPSVA